MVFIRRTRDYLLHLNADEETFRQAHSLRRKMTEAEKRLWNELKNRKLNGLKFRRQHPLRWYIADFYCHERRLVIELDGEIHEKNSIKENDQNRSAELDRLGIIIIRFKNEQILNSLSEVLNEIRKVVNNTPSQISPSP
jgi:very-short-patch-repair endonuclease